MIVTTVWARELVAFMFVEATVRLLVPEMRNKDHKSLTSLHWYEKDLFVESALLLGLQTDRIYAQQHMRFTDNHKDWLRNNDLFYPSGRE